MDASPASKGRWRAPVTWLLTAAASALAWYCLFYLLWIMMRRVEFLDPSNWSRLPQHLLRLVERSGLEYLPAALAFGVVAAIIHHSYGDRRRVIAVLAKLLVLILTGVLCACLTLLIGLDDNYERAALVGAIASGLVGLVLVMVRQPRERPPGSVEQDAG